VGEPWTDATQQQRVCWQPVKRHTDTDDFAGLEAALELAIHPDVKAHYGHFWSANLEAEAPVGHVSLLYLWNPQDVDRLVENLIGHALACRQNRTPFSVFFACTEPDSDLFLTINNDSGAIQLEAPGKKPLRTVAGSLAEFISHLVPAAPPVAKSNAI
jgi:SecY interacting protein Syd